MTDTSSLYNFVYRGLLTEEALDKAGRVSRGYDVGSLDELHDALNFDLLDPDEIDVAEQMAVVYAAITAFERSARRFVAKVLQAEYGDDWWENKVSGRIREKAEARQREEAEVRWHGARGDDLLTYTEMGHLSQIIEQNSDDFLPLIKRVDWAKNTFSTIERSRNVIMHSGVLDIADIERVGVHIRDWVRQVGA